MYKAHDQTLDRVVALKQLIDPSEEQRRAWRAEGQALAALTSPHVVRIFGVHESASEIFLVQEWVEGASVAQLMASGATLSLAQTLGIIRGAALGLADVHDAGLVHGDVSISNIMVSAADGESRLIDFGLATPAGTAVSGLSTGAFRAPEVTAGAPAVPASDVYAVGMVLRQLLDHIGADADKGLRALVDKATAERIDDRYPDGRAFAAALEEAARKEPGVPWWNVAGLGALAGSAAAVLIPVESGVLSQAPPSLLAQAADRGRDATALVGSEARRSAVRTPLLAGIAVTALVVGGIAIAVTRSSSGDGASKVATEASTGTTSPTTTSVTTTTPSRPAVSSSAPDGAYTFRSTITSTVPDPANTAVGATVQGTWTFSTASCTASLCRGSIQSVALSSTSGTQTGVYDWTWDGATLTIAREPAITSNPCDDGTGEVRSQHAFSFGPTTSTLGPDGRMATLRIPVAQRFSLVSITGCTLNADQYQTLTRDITVTR